MSQRHRATVPALALLMALLPVSLAQAAGAPIKSVEAKGISSSHLPVGGVVINPDGRWNHTHSNGAVCNEDDNISVRVNLVDNYTTNYYTYHYFYTPRTGWVGSGWIYHSTASSNEWVLKYAFKEGEVIQTCGFTWKDGVQSSQFNGPTITVGQATVNAPKGYINSYLWVLKYFGKSATKGFEIPWSEIISWAEPWVLDNLAIAAADIRVLDQDGNPLQSYMLPPSTSGSYVRTYSFLGQVHVTNVTNATSTTAVLYDKSVINVTQPNGKDWNFLGVAAQVDLAKYNYKGTDSTHPWGKAVSRIPMVSVVFNKSGALQVNYPQPYSWDTYYEATAVPGSSSPAWSSYLNTATQSVSGSILSLSTGGDWSGYYVNPAFSSITLETRLKVNSGWSRLQLVNSNNYGVVIDFGIESPLRFLTVRLTLTDTAWNLYVDGKLAQSGTPGVAPSNALKIHFGALTNSSVQWDYVVYKGGVWSSSRAMAPLVRVKRADPGTGISTTSDFTIAP
ncbi:MAG: hypothetical protein HYX75_17365 [Acidobacteria bacterium]|nr:hypothetical protein [Acidobacteriota bacterium]